MRTIAIIAQKGGTGKTTLAIHLSTALKGQTAIVDLDPQASASTWADKREINNPVVVSAQASRLKSVLDTAQGNGVKWTILDTAPHSEQSALAAARASDLILLPCRPAILDIQAILTTGDLIKIAQKPALFVISAAPPRGQLTGQAQEIAASYDLPVAQTVIHHRVAFSHSLVVGQTVAEYPHDGRALNEIKSLAKEITSKLV